jgi:putative endonuclease
MNFKVYILWSESLQRFYVGSTNNIEDRLHRHNSGYEKFTSRGRPWIMICDFDCGDRADAVSLENRIKKRGIRRFLEDNKIHFGR